MDGRDFVGDEKSGGFCAIADKRKTSLDVCKATNLSLSILNAARMRVSNLADLMASHTV